MGFAEKEGWPGWDDVVALVPEAEMHDLIIELRSQTLGLGTFRRRFDHLAEPVRYLTLAQHDAPIMLRDVQA